MDDVAGVVDYFETAQEPINQFGNQLQMTTTSAPLSQTYTASSVLPTMGGTK
jgi:hypothetical protein